MFACLYRPPAPGAASASDYASMRGGPGNPGGLAACEALARDFSPRYQRHRDDLVSIDISGLGRLFRSKANEHEDGGEARAIGEALRREAADRGIRVHVAIAGTRTAALILAHARPGLTLAEPGEEAEALAPLSLDILAKTAGCFQLLEAPAFRAWGLKTLGDLAALPSADLAARLGQQGLFWQAIARGEDLHPLVPTVSEERFEASLELEWPIDGLEPLSFVLTRLLEPISVRLERRDRGAAVLHVRLRLVSREIHARSLQLPAPIRDVRTLRTLALLDLESHPPAAAIDHVAILIDPTPGRVLQHTLFTRAHPTPEQVSTLLARLGALMGQDRIGAPATVDSYRPGAFAMVPFAPKSQTHVQFPTGNPIRNPQSAIPNSDCLPSSLRRCRQPVAARVVVDAGRPVHVSSERRGYPGGRVTMAAGPWRTSGEWWLSSSWDRDEWDVALSDGAVYRIFRDRGTNGWFIDALVD
jgi:protein ImuB